MTREEALTAWKNLYNDIDKENHLFVGTINPQMVELAIHALEREQAIKTLGEEMRITQKGITDEKVLLGFNMAIALCNKHIGEKVV